jgi:hypothetical protein
VDREVAAQVVEQDRQTDLLTGLGRRAHERRMGAGPQLLVGRELVDDS